MTQHDVLQCAQAHAARYLDSLPHRPVGATLDAAELRRRLGGPLPQNALDAVEVIDHLVRDVDGGLHSSTGGRFFGWVIGGVLPAALAADWLTATWDQNAASAAASSLLRLGPRSSVAAGVVSGVSASGILGSSGRDSIVR